MGHHDVGHRAETLLIDEPPDQHVRGQPLSPRVAGGDLDELAVEVTPLSRYTEPVFYGEPTDCLLDTVVCVVAAAE